MNDRARPFVNPAAAQAAPPRLDVDASTPLAALQTLVRLTLSNERRLIEMAKTLDDMIVQARATRDAIRANADLDQSIYNALKERDDRLTATLEQLKTAGHDPAKLAELETALQEAADAAEAERTATVAAVKAATPAAGLGAPTAAAAVEPNVNPAAAQADPAPVADPPKPA